MPFCTFRMKKLKCDYKMRPKVAFKHLGRYKCVLFIYLFLHSGDGCLFVSNMFVFALKYVLIHKLFSLAFHFDEVLLKQ